jgi:SAM-dependent methyltransferase
LAEKVGQAGSVLATDLNLDWVDIGNASNVELRIHDVVRDSLPEAEFDLIHARLVLVHLPARDEVMTKLVAALRPGGWLVLEEFTHFLPGVPGVPEPETSAEACVNRVLAAVSDLLRDHGADTVSYPRTLVRRLRSRRLTELGAEGTVIFGQQGVIDVHRANLRQVRDELVATGRVSADDVDLALQTLADPELVATLGMLISAWGRKRA